MGMKKFFKKIAKYGLAVLFGYEVKKDLEDNNKESKDKVDMNEVKQIINNIVEMKQNTNTEKDSSAMEIVIFISLIAIFVAIMIGIGVFCCYKVKSTSAKKAVESYKHDIANK